ncbi:MAG: DUF4258 domain-containing protein [Bacteroidetes bacterium]|nr:MAG: DUF4258 domain-containing protein [Bacteroidota bacterium]
MPAISWTIRRSHQPSFDGTYTGTDHLWQRMSGRSVAPADVERVLHFGRVTHVRGARHFSVGRREIRRYRRQADLSRLDGLHVVCTPDGVVLTVYRNRDFSVLRA